MPEEKIPASTSKGAAELDYWLKMKAREGTLGNRWYERVYTEHFGLDHAFYAGKRILDIGCGPRGSLEWADMATERVGLDPLVDEYLELGADQHAMTYVASGSEEIPFEDGRFDVVCSFNSLDHVDDLDQTIAEILRVVAPGGLFLLVTDVNHRPTVCEPVSFSWEIADRFAPPLELVQVDRFERRPDGLYKSLAEAVPYDDTDETVRYGILSAKFRRPYSEHDR